jgi:uncharacterized membrane protein SirB2
MSIYLAVKYLHIVCAVISITGFVVRGALRLQDSTALQYKLVRILPHVVDTLLLLSAIFLIVQRSEYPFVSGWLTAKTLGLFVYIGFGLATLRFAKTRSGRAAAYVLAILTFAYIVAVAIAKSAWPFGG